MKKTRLKNIDPFFENLRQQNSFRTDLNEIALYMKTGKEGRKNSILKKNILPLKYFSPNVEYQVKPSLRLTPTFGKIYTEYQQETDGIFDYLIYKYKLPESYREQLMQYYFFREHRNFNDGSSSFFTICPNQSDDAIENNSENSEEGYVEVNTRMFIVELEKKYPICIRLKPFFNKKDIVSLTKGENWKKISSAQEKYKKHFNPKLGKVKIKTTLNQDEDNFLWKLYESGKSITEMVQELDTKYTSSGDDNLLSRELKYRDIKKIITRLKKEREI